MAFNKINFHILIIAALFTFNCVHKGSINIDAPNNTFLNSNKDDIEDFYNLKSKSQKKYRTKLKIALAVEINKIKITDITGLIEIIDSQNHTLYIKNDPKNITFLPKDSNIILITKNTKLILPKNISIVKRSDFNIKFKRYHYRGNFLIKNIDSKLYLINKINIDQYLRGVVPNELGHVKDNGAIEALKAQAIVARTYAYAKLNKHQSKGYDLKSTVEDQVYKGIETETKIANNAIYSTKGIIMTYKGLPVTAYYHSTCGGVTASYSNAWGNKKTIPYLQSIVDTMNNTVCCKISYSSDWHKTFTWTEAKKIISKNLKIKINSLDNIFATYYPNKRLKFLYIKFNHGSLRKIYGDNVRWVFKTKSILKSANFYLTTKPQKYIYIEGHGLGHGVGLCQFGTLYRSRHGQKWKNILKTYYKGVNFVNIYH